MICQSCRERRHEECRGGSWCDCQHRPPPAAPERGGAPGTRPAGDDAEPRVNWRRQG
ncbi:hypothetical protein HUT06_28695 [Actinomadura sp. NAK00032]|uniref:hypothetical protein n=1 Tax=Actinomadura sp. NAK00032 TaxID=2742128 RepID=UPI001592689C|nr:hypothetical protein [Actinomadura sp. NAK00032]QKW37496.1 hypothetical protein HUT06_28695 [Actinomadura sp. NAK00032]